MRSEEERVRRNSWELGKRSNYQHWEAEELMDVLFIYLKSKKVELIRLLCSFESSQLDLIGCGLLSEFNGFSK